ncbi:MAG: lytic transglycosylase domain-containing protein [Halocynthiibacter sp.]
MRFIAYSLCAFVVGVMPLQAKSPHVERLENAMESVSRKDYAKARSLQAGAGPLVTSLIERRLLMRGEGRLKDYTAFFARRPNWPDQARLRLKAERLMTSDTPKTDILAFFKTAAPLTGRGAYYLAQARGPESAADMRHAWRTLPIEPAFYATILNAYNWVLTGEDHIARLEMLLWSGRGKEAAPLYKFVEADYVKNAKARAALRARAAGVDTLVAAVPAGYSKGAGLNYERFLWRARKGFDDSAIDLLLEFSASKAKLKFPEKWASYRRILARKKMRAGEGALAYKIASSHHLEKGSNYADLEWLSGYLALNYLKDPDRALSHFTNHHNAVGTPISYGRAGYWKGRAHEARGDADAAQQAYEYGARWQSSFYGQLSAEKLGRDLDPVLLGKTKYPGADSAAYAGESLYQAGMLLLKAGYRSEGEKFFRALGKSVSLPEMGQIADRMIAIEEPHLALMLAKDAARRGGILANAYYPLHQLRNEDIKAPAALSLSIARRESEFDPVVRSHADAYGLMQLLPGTAKLMAKKYGEAYSKAKLTQDWRYNARLGSGYLATLRDEFGPSLILTSVGYNAGPGRSRSWQKTLGDPRVNGADVVDWIEHIPFRETRNYVMRVSEGYTIYAAKLRGSAGPVGLSDALKGR